MDYKFGSCAGCNKLMKYEKFPICKTCEDKYIKQIMDYGYSHGLRATMEEIPVSVLEFFEKEGLLSKDGKIQEKPIDEEDKKARDLATLRQIFGELQETVNNSNHQQPEKKSIGTGMYTRDKKR